jgi:hypothetical protein
MRKKIGKITLDDAVAWVRKNLAGVTITVVVDGSKTTLTAEPPPEPEKE